MTFPEVIRVGERAYAATTKGRIMNIEILAE